MTNRIEVFKNMFSRWMLLVGGVATALTLAMRIWLTPAIRDWETGAFSPNYWVIGLMLLCMVAFSVMGRLCGPGRREISDTPCLALGIALLVAGVALAVGEVLNLIGVIPSLGDAFTTAAAVGTGSTVLTVLQSIAGLTGGASLILLGLRLFSEGGTRRGIAQWSALLPVAWMWLRLINYEMSYSSMVRLEDSFFGFVMLLVEMWFLFRLARYVAGVGRVSMGSLLACSLSTALFSLTAPLVRLYMYLLQDYASYEMSIATVSDFAVGLLAATVAVTLVFSYDSEEPTTPSAVDAEASAEFASSDAYLVADLVDTDIDLEEEDASSAE